MIHEDTVWEQYIDNLLNIMIRYDKRPQGGAVV